MNYALRPATPADCEWLAALRRLTMRPYVEETWHIWDDAVQKARFEDPDELSKIQIITVGGRDAGLWHVERNAQDIFLANVQIHPDFQNRGLGSTLIVGLMREAHTRRLPLRLQVLKANAPARRLYERLGLRAFDETSSHVLMIWRPH
jgi:ribosomal protein S18 acetylase RimI-like enzyme